MGETGSWLGAGVPRKGGSEKWGEGAVAGDFIKGTRCPGRHHLARTPFAGEEKPSTPFGVPHVAGGSSPVLHQLLGGGGPVPGPRLECPVNMSPARRSLPRAPLPAPRPVCPASRKSKLLSLPLACLTPACGQTTFPDAQRVPSAPVRRLLPSSTPQPRLHRAATRGRP